jgi:hypothetical protein
VARRAACEVARDGAPPVPAPVLAAESGGRQAGEAADRPGRGARGRGADRAGQHDAQHLPDFPAHLLEFYLVFASFFKCAPSLPRNHQTQSSGPRAGSTPPNSPARPRRQCKLAAGGRRSPPRRVQGGAARGAAGPGTGTGGRERRAASGSGRPGRGRAEAEAEELGGAGASSGNEGRRSPARAAGGRRCPQAHPGAWGPEGATTRLRNNSKSLLPLPKLPTATHPPTHNRGGSCVLRGKLHGLDQLIYTN